MISILTSSLATHLYCVLGGGIAGLAVAFNNPTVAAAVSRSLLKMEQAARDAASKLKS
jgi:hypothetical protein